MARRKAKRGGRRAKSIPIAIAAPMAVPLIRAYQQSGSYGAKADRLLRSVTGVSIDGKDFNVSDALPFWTAMGAGIIVHKVANKVGVNNYVRRMSFGYFSL